MNLRSLITTIPASLLALQNTITTSAFKTPYIQRNSSKNIVIRRRMNQNVVAEFDRVLPFTDHSHNSILIHVDDDFVVKNKSDFKNQMEATIEACRGMKKSSIWVQIPMKFCGVVEELNRLNEEFLSENKHKFEFHHAEGSMVHLYLWLNNHSEVKIPEYGTHQVGVGALVVNSRNEILCVRELRNNYRPWKIPGGLADLGENLNEAAEREVLEETGIRTQFESVLGVRHTHGLQFNRSDLYFVCQLSPVIEDDGKIPEPVPQQGEIAAAAWVPLQEYKDMVFDEENGHPMMKNFFKVYEQGSRLEPHIVSSIVPGRKPSPIFHPPILED